jgi:hypothetical protein
MNLIKKTTLAVSIALAMAFTFGCSDDDDKKEDPKPKWCVTGTAPYLFCQELGDPSSTMTLESCEADRYSKVEMDLPEGCKNCLGEAATCSCLGASCPK